MTMDTSPMSFQDVSPYLRVGSLVKRSEWEGFWVKDGDDIAMITAGGEITSVKQSDNIHFTLDMVAGGLWYKLDKTRLVDYIGEGELSQKAVEAYVRFLREHGHDTSADKLQNDLDHIPE